MRRSRMNRKLVRDDDDSLSVAHFPFFFSSSLYLIMETKDDDTLINVINIKMAFV